MQIYGKYFLKQAFFFGGGIDKMLKYVEEELRRELLIKYLQWEHKHIEETDTQVSLEEGQSAAWQYLGVNTKGWTERPMVTLETQLLFAVK